MTGKSEVNAHDGIDRAANDEAARVLLNPSPEMKATAGLLPEIDSATGEVAGTGSGAGGGNRGEDFDDDHTAGSNTVR